MSKGSPGGLLDRKGTATLYAMNGETLRTWKGLISLLNMPGGSVGIRVDGKYVVISGTFTVEFE